MYFALGYIIGLLTATIMFLILAFFRVGVERQVRIIERTLEQAGPKPQGFIIEPEDEAELARRKHIEKNRRHGKDTPISELL